MSITQDEIAAAYRLDALGLGYFQGPSTTDADMRAGIICARALLREHPSEQPITPEALESIGWTIDANGSWWSPVNEHCIALQWLADEAAIYFDGYPLATEANFDELNALCRALKIPTKASE